MPAVKGQKYNIEPKPKIKKVFDKVVENGGNVSKAMTEVGYPPASAKNPQKITRSKSWEKLLQQHIPDSKLAKVLNEGLDAIDDKGTTDYAIRHKYLETGLKLKAKFPKEQLENPLDGDLKVLLVQINNVINAKG